MNPYKTQEQRMFSRFKIFSAIGVAIVATVVIADAFSDYNSPEEEYAREFAGDKGCLRYTTYDPRSGADLDTDRVEGDNVLRVSPGFPSSYGNLVLQFTIGEDVTGSPTLTAANTATSSVLQLNGCYAE